MTHRDLCHEGLLLGAAEDCLDARIATELLTDMVHHAHDRVLIPPRRILNALDLTTHHDDLASGNELASAIRGSQMGRDTRRRYISTQSIRQSSDHLRPLS